MAITVSSDNITLGTKRFPIKGIYYTYEAGNNHVSFYNRFTDLKLGEDAVTNVINGTTTAAFANIAAIDTYIKPIF